MKIPNKVKSSAKLSDYSVETRYPGDYDEIKINEYNQVIKIAEFVNSWVTRKIIFRNI